MCTEEAIFLFLWNKSKEPNGIQYVITLSKVIEMMSYIGNVTLLRTFTTAAITQGTAENKNNDRDKENQTNGVKLK